MSENLTFKTMEWVELEFWKSGILRRVFEVKFIQDLEVKLLKNVLQ